MSLLIFERLTDEFLYHKAPRNTMYHIHSIVFSMPIAINIFALIFARELKSPTGSRLDTTSSTSDLIAVHTHNVVGSFEISGINETCKSITIGKNDAQSSDVRVSIYGDIVKASRKDLIIEWFRKA